MAAALAAHELGLSVLIVEKSSFVGGSTARSGGALWLPAGPVLDEAGAHDTAERANTYLESVVAGSAPRQRSTEFVTHVPATVAMLRRTTPLRLFWARDYSDYHPRGTGRQRGRTDLRVPSAEHLAPGGIPHPAAARCHGGQRPGPDDGRGLPLDESDGPRATEGHPDDRQTSGPGRGRTARRPSLRGGRPGPDGRAVRRRAAGWHPGVDRHHAVALHRRFPPCHRRGGGSRRPRVHDHRSPRGDAGHRRLRPQHGHAVEIPVRIAGRQPEPGRGEQHRATGSARLKSWAPTSV